MHEMAQQALDRLKVKQEYFVDVRIWPVQADFDPDGWLRNFTEDDLPLAALLLDSFAYFSSQIADAMFLAAVQSISIKFAAATHADSARAWRGFMENALFCIVTGENPNPSDSGYIFARKARQVLDISEERLVEPQTCLELLTHQDPVPVVFVDDFVGSGNQFATMWTRGYQVGSQTISFSDLAIQMPHHPFYYCPVLATAEGVEVLKQWCQTVHLHPAHIIDPISSPLHPSTTVFPPELRERGQEMIKRVSLSIGIPEHMWQGYHRLGCTVAFEHCIPDATLPLFYWSQNWKPLMRRK